MLDTPPIPKPEKEHPIWREIRLNDIEDTKKILTLGTESVRGEGVQPDWFPDQEQLQKTQYRGLMLERRGEALGAIWLAASGLDSLYPTATMPIYFAFIRPSEFTENLRSSTITVIHDYASKSGFKNIGWFAALRDMETLTGIHPENETGIVSVPIDSFNTEGFRKMQQTPQTQSKSPN